MAIVKTSEKEVYREDAKSTKGGATVMVIVPFRVLRALAVPRFS